MTSVYKNWDNEEVFKEQLSLNLRQLSDFNLYPNHWHHFLEILKRLSAKRLLDIGCGCGAYYELCKRHIPNIAYVGMDFSAEAIKLAKLHWNYDKFFVKDLFDITKEDVSEYDVIHLGALLDVLDDGDKGLDHILSTEAKIIIIGRIELTTGDSFCKKYKAYDKIEAVQFHHNIKNLLTICEKRLYSVSRVENTLILKNYELSNKI